MEHSAARDELKMSQHLAREPAPVLSLLITSADEDILYGIRDPVANRTFPNTISVPTQRIPAALAEALTMSAITVHSSEGELFYEPQWHSNHRESGHCAVIFAAETILATKLGAAPSLERGALQFDATLASLTTSMAKHGNLEDPDEQMEAVEMLTMVVKVTTGKETIPSSTNAYTRLAWAPRGAFAKAVRNRDPLVLVPAAHPAEICVQGVCTYAAARLIGEGSWSDAL